MYKILKHATSTLLLVFGLISLFLTTSVVFDLFGIREKEGNYVPFIVYANLVCGAIYVYVAFLNWKNKKNSVLFLSFATIILIVAYSALMVYVNGGGVHEHKTVNAMLFRIVFTAIMTGLIYFNQLKLKNND